MSLSVKMPLGAAAFLAISAAPSFAAIEHKITDLGTLSSTDSQTYDNKNLVGRFKDYITFTITPTQTDLSATITNTYTFRSQGANIRGLTLNLYQGTLNTSTASLDANGGGTALFPTAIPTTNTPATPGSPGQEQGGFAYTFTTPGNYYIQIAADPGSTAKASYGGSINYVLTPLPSTLPMLAGAVLAIAAGGHIVTRRRSVKSVAA